MLHSKPIWAVIFGFFLFAAFAPISMAQDEEAVTEEVYALSSDKRPNISQLEFFRRDNYFTGVEEKSDDGFYLGYTVHWGDFSFWTIPTTHKQTPVVITYTLLGDDAIVLYRWRIMNEEIGDYDRYIAFSDGPIFQENTRNVGLSVEVLSVEEGKNMIKVTINGLNEGDEPQAVKKFTVKGNL